MGYLPQSGQEPPSAPPNRTYYESIRRRPIWTFGMVVRGECAWFSDVHLQSEATDVLISLDLLQPCGSNFSKEQT